MKFLSDPTQRKPKASASFPVNPGTIVISDLDREMEERGLESLIVFGDQTLGNPDLAYVVGASLPRGGIYIKRRSHSPTVIVSNIDVGSAKQGRVSRIKSYSDYGFEKIYSRFKRDEARARFYQKLIREEGLSGPIAVAGRNDTSSILYLVDSLRKGRVKVVGEKSPTLLESVRETKDRFEINRLREVGKKTCWVVTETMKFLRSTEVRGRRIAYKSKQLTVGDVRKVIGRLLVQKDLVAPEDTIFAPGKGSSDPHYRGENEDQLHPNEPVVFDIFPSEPDGYWHDTTRTLTLGPPHPKVKEMYDAVLGAQDLALDMVREEAPCQSIFLASPTNMEQGQGSDSTTRFDRLTDDVGSPMRESWRRSCCRYSENESGHLYRQDPRLRTTISKKQENLQSGCEA